MNASDSLAAQNLIYWLHKVAVNKEQILTSSVVKRCSAISHHASTPSLIECEYPLPTPSVVLLSDPLLPFTVLCASAGAKSAADRRRPSSRDCAAQELQYEHDITHSQISGTRYNVRSIFTAQLGSRMTDSGVWASGSSAQGVKPRS